MAQSKESYGLGGSRTWASLLGACVTILAACSGQDGGGGAAPSEVPAATPEGPKAALSVTVDGPGSVRSEPAGIDCPGRCSAEFVQGSRVVLVSEPAEGWRFDAWSGACSGNGVCEVVVGGAVTVHGVNVLIDPRWDPSVGAADCKEAWGDAGERLSPCDKEPDDYVVVRKGSRNVALCKAGALVKNMRAGLGFAPDGDKVRQGDGKTPEGVFYIPRVLPDSDYYLALLLSYPTREAAARGAAEGIVSRQESDAIMAAHAACTEPSQSTALGGAIEIHGEGGSRDWTAGCVAIENSEMDLLFSVVGVGDTIVVHP